jgi:hypothetical protein
MMKGVLMPDHWNEMSDDWKQGWKDAHLNKDLRMSQEEMQSKSSDWKAGLKYAIQHYLPWGIVERVLN